MLFAALFNIRDTRGENDCPLARLRLLGGLLHPRGMGAHYCVVGWWSLKERKKRLLDSIPETVRVILSEYLSGLSKKSL